MAIRHRPAQTSLAARGRRGGYRAGAGRPPKAAEERTGHHPRPPLPRRLPVHVTMKRVQGGPRFRRLDCYAVLRGCFAAGRDRFGFRLVHYSVQSNHIHLICEAEDQRSLSRGMQGLTVRVARRVNRHAGRDGKLFARRYRERILRTPREVRNALLYVLRNGVRHGASPRGPLLDVYSSAFTFDGWREQLRRVADDGEAPVVAPTRWLLATGWRARWGPLSFDETPAAASDRPGP